MIDIFSNLSRVFKKGGEEEVTPEQQAAAEKARRIEFHRESVRNGPVQFKSPTTGQRRRAAVRAQKREARKQFRQAVHEHHARQREAAVLRGKLQAVGVLPYVSRGLPDLAIRARAIVWLIDRFEVTETDEKAVEIAINKAWQRYTSLVGLPGNTRFVLGSEGVEVAK